jgi:putative nucleotidyltransferase with HDIG domain
MSESTTLQKIKEYVNSMPSLPTTVTKVMEICNDPKTSPVDLNRVISLDPVLMGKVLKLINSAYYGLSQQVTTLVRAIIMLGVNTVKNLALSTAVIDKLGDKKAFQALDRALNMDGFWRHSLAAGTMSKLIAKKRGVDPKFVEEYFTAGLLHDIGKIPLNNVFPEHYVETIAYSDRERVPIHKAEAAVLGTDHQEIGGVIADSWRLDPGISDTIRHHHDYLGYEGPAKDILYTLAVADFYAIREEIGFSGTRYPEKVAPEVYAYLGLSRDTLDAIAETVNQEIEKAKIFLKLGA